MKSGGLQTLNEITPQRQMNQSGNIFQGHNLRFDFLNKPQKFKEKFPPAIDRATLGGVAGERLTWRTSGQYSDFSFPKQRV